ncbi:MAG: dihydrolipoamide acetyltransferase family protein [Planctomycetota bacterium]|nr:dihydrolipoamide acetyltransferase family protein [Planctomycetota bacterium]
MAIEIVVPRLGWSMEEGVFGEWLKQPGEEVVPGDMLFVLEGEKAAQEVESFDGGVLSIPAGAPQPGDTVQVGQLLGYLLAAGEASPAELPARPAATASEPAVAGPAVRQLARELNVELEQVSGTGSGGRVSAADVRLAAEETAPAAAAPSRGKPRGKAISPRARRVARELEIDWTEIVGTGRTGRIRESDVRAAASQLSATGGGLRADHDRSNRISPLRKTIAQRMSAATAETAAVTLHTEVDATNLVNLRGQFRSANDAQEGVPGYNDILVKLTALALGRHPHLQSQWREGALWVPGDVHIAIGVDTDQGLLAPVIRDVPSRSLRQLAVETRRLAEKARAGALTVDEMQGGTFTISNLGNYGVDAFTPIINLPQSAILGVGRIRQLPVVVGEQVLPRFVVALSLTFDHRVHDGGPAARFLNTLREFIEQPGPWLID